MSQSFNMTAVRAMLAAAVLTAFAGSAFAADIKVTLIITSLVAQAMGKPISSRRISSLIHKSWCTKVLGAFLVSGL